MKKSALCFIILAIAATAFAYMGDETLKLAVKNYRNAHYIRALQQFREAEKAGLGKENIKFAKYAIDVLTRLKRDYAEIEKIEIALKYNRYNSELKTRLAAANFLLASKLVEKEFYADIVEPHLLRAIGLESENIRALLALASVYYNSLRYAKAVKYCDVL